MAAPRKAPARGARGSAKPRAPRRAAKPAFAAIEVALANGLALVWLDPARAGALDASVVAELTETFAALAKEPAVRAVVIASRGEAFCPGGAPAGRAALERLLDTMGGLAKPVIVRLHGQIGAGGVALAAAADIALAASESELRCDDPRVAELAAVRAAFGSRAASRYLLTAEPFDGAEAYRIGFVHELAPARELDGTLNGLLGHLANADADALARRKRILRESTCSRES